jgi:hypothetical protein
MDDVVICPYCNKPARLVDSRGIYGPRALQLGNFWQCRPCDAYVGCHGFTNRPLGTLANAELRAARKEAHGFFDGLWRRGGKFANRREAYKWLANKMGKSGNKTHIAMFDVGECKKVVELCRKEAQR